MARPISSQIATLTLLSSFVLWGQEANPTQKPRTQTVESDPNSPVPIFRIEVIARTTQAINYLHRGGSTKVDFQGTPLLATGKGSAKVESERGVIKVSAEFKNMAAPSSFGPEYLTYVLWAISPDGRPVNLGELTLSDYGAGSTSKIDTTSDIQTFGMIVTAEPYYGVTQPSDVVVMENVVRPDTRGVVEAISARFELLPRGMYTNRGKAAGFKAILVGKKDPFELYEAENAVQLSRVAGADRYAAESFQKAQASLDQALKYQAQKPGQKPVITMAREAVVRAEDARVIALRAERNEAQENERLAGVARENAEKAKAESARMRADEEARQRAQADAARVQSDEARMQSEAARVQADAARAQAEKDRMAAERAKSDAETATQTAQRERADAERAKAAAMDATKEAEAARQAALAQQQQLASEADRARLAAAESDRMRMKAEQDQAQLRQQLLDQFNSILQTRDTARGLIVNMSDVLFDTARYTLKPGAREKLAKVSGIILGHPGLKIEVEGHTDSVGGDDYNMKLSENRANGVRDYLVSQGINAASVSAKGFGKTMPVADNGSAAGRQMNRRVELVVSGEILGTTLTTTRTTSSSIRQ